MENNLQKKQLALTPIEKAAPAVGRMLAMLEDARRRTITRLETGNLGEHPEALDRVDVNSGSTLGSLLYHIAAVEASWLYEDVLQREMPPEIDALFPVDVRDEQGQLMRLAGVPLSEHLDRLEKVRAALLEAYCGFDLDQFQALLETSEYWVTPEYVLHHLMQHEAEHRSQIEALIQANR